MVTRSPDPQITPDTAATIAMINFSITRSGLEDQLLSKTITAEQPELERRKSEILQQEEELQARIEQERERRQHVQRQLAGPAAAQRQQQEQQQQQ